MPGISSLLWNRYHRNGVCIQPETCGVNRNRARLLESDWTCNKMTRAWTPLYISNVWNVSHDDDESLCGCQQSKSDICLSGFLVLLATSARVNFLLQEQAATQVKVTMLGPETRRICHICGADLLNSSSVLVPFMPHYLPKQCKVAVP